MLAKRDTKSTQSDTSQSASEAATAAIITYTDDGFSPATVTVVAGSTITVENESSGELEFKSGKHPAHNDNTELNQEEINSGESLSFTVNKVGTWGYHNHYDADKKGTIVVRAK